MLRSSLLLCFLFLSSIITANIITVKNIAELNEANDKAKPGDIIILQNGKWENVTIKLNCNGTKEKPIIFRAQTAGKVLITGNSKLKIGGEYVTIDGLNFINGYSGKDDVIEFRIDNKQLANNCRVTNVIINDFNNPKRIDENNWVSFYGKNNRLDHCSFINKKNLGVLLAVMLDDERSRENFHSIDHNYFGKRPALASNGGEIIRIGLAQHCQFNSNTQIKNNFFEECDGETEIISIKSCSNIVEKNVFRECQGSVVLRHGNDNLVNENLFLGNNKTGSGGVRVINKGQKVLNNIFYKCRGVDFRSPLVIMNGVPNSPPTRYVQVSDAQITGNIFYECSAISLCEGSDSERTMTPVNVIIAKNTFYNTNDSIIYRSYDDIKGITFTDNRVSKSIPQELIDGFQKTSLPSLPPFLSVENETLKNSGATWFIKQQVTRKAKVITVNCSTTDEIIKQLERKEPMVIRLTGKKYLFSVPAFINSDIEIQAGNKGKISFGSTNILSVFIIKGKSSLKISHTDISADDIRAVNFISSDTSGSAEHYSFAFDGSSISDLRAKRFYSGCKSSLADSIIIRNSQFMNNECNILIMADEKEDRGYYNAEKIFIGHNKFINQSGSLFNIYRGGSDESTLGPHLILSHNKFENCKSDDALIKLTGVQQTEIFSNQFFDCNPSGDLITYKDLVRAKHYLRQNKMSNSGRIEKNKYVEE